MAQETLRERKKRETRRTIAEAARRLFLDRGFASVTVAEVAKAADVSEPTVFNYFATKEDLFFSGMEAFEAELVEAVTSRPPGESALTAFRRVLVEGSRRLQDDRAADGIARAARVIADSRALQAREREIIATYTDRLAKVLEEETRACTDVEAWTVANALMGVHHAILTRVRAAVLSGHRGRTLARTTRDEATRAFGVLERGLRDFGARP